MFRAIMRERRKNAWKSRRKWQKAVRQKKRHEEEVRKAIQYAQPDRWMNVNGVVIGVHVLRDRFRGPVQYRFEFYRKDSAQKGLAPDFGEHDLRTLAKAIEAAARYRKFVEARQSSKRSTNSGARKAKPSKVTPHPHVRQGSRN